MADILNAKESWDKHTGKEVQDFICNNLIGYTCWSTNPDSDNFYHLWGFRTKADYGLYKADPIEHADLLIFDQVLKISISKDSYTALLVSNIDTNVDIIISDNNKLLVPLRFHSIRTASGERINLGANGTLNIERSTNNGISWTKVATIVSGISSQDITDTTHFKTFDLTKYLTSGSQKFRINAEYQYTNEDGNQQVATSPWVIIGNSITKTKLSLVQQRSWQSPLYAEAIKQQGFPLNYMVYGAVSKTLHVIITGGNNKDMPEIKYSLLKSDDSVSITKYITDTLDKYKLFDHGVRTVKAWLTCEDGLGGTITSDVLINRFMVINKLTPGADLNRPYLLLQNLITTAANYEQTTLCQYSVYSPVIRNGVIYNEGDPVNVTFYLTDYAENILTDPHIDYFKIGQKVSPGVIQILSTTIEIEDSGNNEITSYFRVYRTGKDGNEYNFMLESNSTDNVIITVDNSKSFAPAQGTNFLINPKIRNNNEVHPDTIINAKNSIVVPSTFTNFDFINNGWITSEYDNQKVLRVTSGSTLSFTYNPFKQFITTPDSAMTLEIDFAVHKITDETKPILQALKYINGHDRGLILYPLGGNLYTKSNIIDTETDFYWQEDKRIHLTINLHNAVAPNKGDVHVPNGFNTSKTKIALARIYINGNKQRELEYSISDSEEFADSLVNNIIIGAIGADIDIYSIRCYENLALEETDVLKNYISSLPTTEQKLEVRKRNNILTAGKIDIEKVKALGKNCLVWHGIEPYHENTGQQKGWWEIFRYSPDGTYLPEYSGTLCKESKSLGFKRQGSTANTYFDSNGQSKMTDVKALISVPLVKLHESIKYTKKTVDDKQVLSIYGGNLGKDFPIKNTTVDYEYDELTDTVKVPDGWIDGNGLYRGVGYIINDNAPMAQKLVNKINYASSMQSHLCGINNLYNDLHTAIVGKNSIQKSIPTARVSKYTLPFYYFMQEDENGPTYYRGGATFGAGKMDKPTWGYVKKSHPMFMMVEGSDNNYELTDMRVPFTWNQPTCSENIRYSPADEGFFYGDKQCLDFDAGATEEDGTPKSTLITVLQDAWNFVYLHSTTINYYNGTFDQFQTSPEAQNTHIKYWCTKGTDEFLLKRYNFIDSRWEDAGLWDGTKFAKIDLRTWDATKDTYNQSTNKSVYSVLNKELRQTIIEHAKTYLPWYFDTNSLRFYYTFVIHLMAGTDSCSKNTYYVIDPTPTEVRINGITKSVYRFQMHSDDIDTALVIDNNGRSTKKYYIDRMHPYNDEDPTTSKYEGMNNTLFNLCEAMWEDTKELQSMLKNIFTTMTTLVSQRDYIEGWTDSSKVSIWGCLYKYIFWINHYFSETAFNEQGRIRYEYPHMIGFISSGSGARQIDPITQSNGSLLDCELQFTKRRLIYMASYATWGNFYDGGKSGTVGISDANESFSMQAFHVPGRDSSENTYKFSVTPYQYIYPTGMLGQTNIDPHKRAKPGVPFDLNLGTTTSNDTGMSILGINYYTSIGNVGDLSTTPANTLTVNGKRLTEFIAEPTKTYEENGKHIPAFRPGQIRIQATELNKLSLAGCTGISGNIDCSNLRRLKELDLKNTALVECTFPESSNLTTIYLPATITSVVLTNQKELSTLAIQDYNSLKKFVIKNNSHLDTYNQALSLYKTKPDNLKTISLDCNWENIQADINLIRYLYGLKASLTGKITTSNLTFKDKEALVALYGNIDSTNSDLYVKYESKTITKALILGEHYPYLIKDHDYILKVLPENGNNVNIVNNKLDLQWTLPAASSLYATIKNHNIGTITVKDNDPTKRLFDLNCNINTTNGLITGTKSIGFYKQVPKVGDFAYADGTFDDEYDSTKEFVGLVFMVIQQDAHTYDIRVVSKEFVVLTTTDGSTTYDRLCFGIFRDTYYYGKGATTGSFSDAELAVIERAVGISHVEDVPTITNQDIPDKKYYFPWPREGAPTDLYRTTTTDDGYQALPQNTLITNYNGKINTKNIVNHVTNIINNYLHYTIPTTTRQLADSIKSIIAENSSDANKDRFGQLYFPAGFGAYLYEPNINNLADIYKKTKWYLPATGEIMRILNFWFNDDMNATKEAYKPIFKLANEKIGKNIFDIPGSYVLGSSSELLNSNFVGNSTTIGEKGIIYYWYNPWSGNYESKNYGSNILPCCSIIMTV